MFNDTLNHAPFDLSGTNSILATTPTPAVQTPAAQVDPPTGWVFAGIMLILLVMMLFNTIKRYILKLLKKDKPNAGHRRTS